MFENMINFFKKLGKKEEKNVKVKSQENSKSTAKERLHLVLMQDRANVSADFLELMKQEIIEVIKKYVEVDEKEIDVKLTNQENDDGTNGPPALYANIPILNIKNDARKININQSEKKEKIENNKKDDNSSEKKENKLDNNIKVEENEVNKPNNNTNKEENTSKKSDKEDNKQSSNKEENDSQNIEKKEDKTKEEAKNEVSSNKKVEKNET